MKGKFFIFKRKSAIFPPVPVQTSYLLCRFETCKFPESCVVYNQLKMYNFLTAKENHGIFYTRRPHQYYSFKNCGVSFWKKAAKPIPDRKSTRLNSSHVSTS